jgi:DNA-binding transcriptional LysR family regulator
MAISLAQVDLAALRLFVAVAQTGKISAGAMTCHLSVAAASKRISDLETRLGYGLFDRHARGVVATEAGERVLAYARQVIGLTESLENDLSDEMQGIEGSVRLFANSSAIVQFLPTDLSGFLAGHPSRLLRYLSTMPELRISSVH